LEDARKGHKEYLRYKELRHGKRRPVPRNLGRGYAEAFEELVRRFNGEIPIICFDIDEVLIDLSRFLNFSQTIRGKTFGGTCRKAIKYIKSEERKKKTTRGGR
jgi:hypothetical protein